jgi:chemosensory pili system protein ChpA (sensor histidine kinase/response regulator)
MSENMSESIDDLSALAWVHDELRRSLESAHKALRRHLKESETLGQSDVDVVDPAILRSARVQIHQGVGALELVGLRAAATMLRASEAAVVRFMARPDSLTLPYIEDVERASFALLDYLSRMLAGKSVSPLSLFPQYRAVQEAAGATRVHPADLWPVDWRWLELPASTVATPRRTDLVTRELFERELLKLIRDDRPLVSAARLSEICAGLGAGADHMPVATLWKLASAVFEAQARELLPVDVYGKRVASRLLAQFRALERNESEVSDRLAQDLLFFCAQSAEPTEGHKAHRLSAVRQAYGLASHKPVDYSRRALGQFDPSWIAQARKRVGAAKESWSAVAGGEMHRIAGLTEQFSLVADSLKRLFPEGELLGNELLRSVSQSQASGQPPHAPLAMEVATSLLYVDAVLEDGDFNHSEQPERVRRLAARLAAVRNGEAPEPLEVWMEELYRRVADRQTMGSVVQELRASLSEAEKLIDEFFRNTSEPKPLLLVPKHLSAMRGVLSVLGMDHAAMALLRMRNDIDGLSSTAIDPERVAQAGVFDRIAGNLGALGFLIDMLSVQPQMAKLLFAYDAAAGRLSPVMGRASGRQEAMAASAEPALPVAPRLIEKAQNLAISALHQHVPVADVARDLEHLSHEALAADQVGLAETMRDAKMALGQARTDADIDSVRGRLSEALIDFVSSVSDAAAIEPELASLRSEPVPAPVAHVKGRVALDEGDELRMVFLEEAREVLGAAEAARLALTDEPGELAHLTAVRRALHTLKGSSRMVGLKDFGEGAWICERIYNTQLADQQPADPALLEFTQWALEYLKTWISDVESHRLGGHSSATIAAAAQLLADRRADAGSQKVSDIALPLIAQEQLLAAVSRPAGLGEAAEVHESESTTRLGQAAADQASELEAPASFELPSLFGTLTSEPAAFGSDELPLPLDGNALSIEEPAQRSEAGRPEIPQDVPELTDVVGGPGDDGLPLLTTEIVDPENIKVVGSLRIGIPLFNIYLNEADELSRRLTTELAEWAMELHRPIGETAIATAHSLAGSSATVGFTDLSDLARTLEHALTRSAAIGHGTEQEARLFVDCAEEIRRMLHQFAAGFLVGASPLLLERLAEHEISSSHRLDAATAASDSLPPDGGGESPSIQLGPLLDVPELGGASAATVRSDQGQAPSGGERTDSDRTESLHAAPTTDHTSPRRRPQAFEASGFVELTPFPEHPEGRPKSAPVSDTHIHFDEDIDAVDVMDPELFPIFEEEAQELLPQLAGHLRDWAREPAHLGPASACMRTLHTLKGGARLAGAMRLGEMAHRLETRIEHLVGARESSYADIESLQAACDVLAQVFDSLRSRDAQAHADAAAAITDVALAPAKSAADQTARIAGAVAVPSDEPPALPPSPAARPVHEHAPAPEQKGAPAFAGETGVTDLPAFDWSRFALSAGGAAAVPDRHHPVSQSAVRVRAPLLDRLVNQAGEVSITRSRIETEVGQIKGSLTDLTDNLERLRLQLRDIELQAETQMSSRLEAAKAADQSFDPLEFDRFTRFQEVTRMMAESVNDVATVQRTLQRSLESTEDELAAQARMTRELQDDLLRTRMVEFEGLSDRFYRVVRQAAKETGKQVRLDITGGAIEIDRGVLDRMTGTFEHLLRNCVTHGIEPPQVRKDAGKDPTGSIAIVLSQEGNEVGVEVRDDGAGLNLGRIRARGEAMGLIDPDQHYSDAELANLIFIPGFSTADNVTELAGRGIGMDVVRSEVNGIGGRVETATAPNEGTSFKLVLPLTTAVTQVVMLRCGETTVAVPSTLVEIVRRTTPAEIEQAYGSGVFVLGERAMPFYWLGALLQTVPTSLEAGARTRSVVVVRSAQQRLALHVDEVLGNQEVVVKNLGPQLSRLPGLAGVTLLASGAVALIYNPVALATMYGAAARAATDSARQAPAPQLQKVVPGQTALLAAPLVLVVDDSLTVRRVTQRLLVREGYRVALAKDGLEALERLGEEMPQVVLTDIEMPRMDGFDLVRNIRGDTRLKTMPVIMITSRIAQKHREYATELGVDHYLGKPYSEEDLLALIGHYTSAGSTA